jgi:glutaminyl-tRNA synthetase
MLVLDPIKVTIDDLSSDYAEHVTIPFDPKNPAGSSRVVPLTRSIYIDRSDFREEASADFFRLAPGKTVGLLSVPFAIKVVSVDKDSTTGKVTAIHANKVDNEKPKAYIHWVPVESSLKVTARQYNTLFNCEEPNTLDWKYGGYAEALNPESEVIFENALIEPGFKELISEKKAGLAPESGAGDDLVRFQALRTAYFVVDSDSRDDSIILNQIVTLKEDSGKGK